MELVGQCGRGILLWLTILELLTGCGATTIQSAVPPSPGGPRIANLRFDPEAIRAGQTTVMSFYFEVGTANVQEALLFERGIEEFQFYSSLQHTPVDLRKYSGQVAATVEIPLSWPRPGIRIIEVYVVTAEGNQSNRLVGRVTVD